MQINSNVPQFRVPLPSAAYKLRATLDTMCFDFMFFNENNAIET